MGILPDLNDFIECALCIKAAGGIDTSCPFIYSEIFGVLEFMLIAVSITVFGNIKIFGGNYVSDFLC